MLQSTLPLDSLIQEICAYERSDDKLDALKALYLSLKEEEAEINLSGVLKIVSQFSNHCDLQEYRIDQMQCSWILPEHFPCDDYSPTRIPDLIFAFEHIDHSWEKSIVKAYKNKEYCIESILVFSVQDTKHYALQCPNILQHLKIIKNLNLGLWINIVNEKKLLKIYSPNQKNDVFKKKVENKKQVLRCFDLLG